MHVPDAVGCGGSERDAFVPEGLTHSEYIALEGDAAGDIDGAHLVVGSIGEGRQGFRERPRARRVSGDGRVYCGAR